ncbi:MDIS1-interacting receptor like kinase 2-like [Phalaenopsis equestris]|uniref:MDIS1-interacting receptor like kinase 2-like n=1 Tax=Phalaenopsis equestris TaxID=78828 RepID=UPI0009E5C5E0|nr:MDIS1-interacting receptor like kinase 2-like [Phalaenopsis equestris]
MERFEFSLLLVFTLSFYWLRVESEGGFSIRKVNQRCSAEERDALLDVKQSLSDPHLLLSTWDTDKDCCIWKGVSCSNKINHVIKLDFSTFSDIEGDVFYAASLHPSFFRLRHLQYLCLGNILFNQIRIPHSIGSLNNLSHLDLSSSGFVGEIPPQIGNLTKLRYLDLSYNSLVAYNLLWISHLFSLQFIDMSNVNLTFATNWLHEISALPALSTLYLSSCNLKTPPNLLSYSNFSSTIKTFDLYNNHLNGSLSNWLGQFKRIKALYLDSNFLTGPISLASLSLLCDLYFLGLSDNNFTKLSDDGNALKCKEYKLTNLDISNNQLCGSMPEWVGNMTNLSWLYLRNNQFNGLIPQSLGQLTNLVFLDLHSNNLHGSLSEIHFANLSQLKSINLSGNQLNFNMVSPNWTPPFQINFLDLSSCPIGPQFPLWLQNQKLLSFLDLSNCGISDIIPSWFWNISSQIEYLNMSQNAIRGELPMSLNIALEATIDLNSNQLEGRLPRPMNFVQSVSFSNNKFTSGIELYLNGNMSLLEVLDLSQNHLSSEIPNSICQMPSIILLDLSHNNLSEEIPNCNGNVSSYKMLRFAFLFSADLMSYPRIPVPDSVMIDIKGTPCWIDEPEFVKKPIHGTNTGVMQSLEESLDLSRNHFSGGIPESIVMLSALSYFNLSYNQLSGRIPTGTQLDTFNESIYYGNPKLCGKPLHNTCEGDEHKIHGEGDNSQDDDDDFGLFLSMGLGFAVGLWIVLGTLFLKRSWPTSYFEFLDRMINNIYEFVNVKVNQWFNQ